MIHSKETIIQEFVQNAVEILNEDVSKIIMYGSYARGDQTENSDIDLMILTSLAEKEISYKEKSIYELAFDFFMKYFVEISVILKNEIQFNHWVNDLPFYNNVQREGIVIYG